MMAVRTTAGVVVASVLAFSAVAAAPAVRRARPAAVVLTPAQRFLAHNRVADRLVRQTPSGLQYKRLAAGTGTEHPGATDVAQVTYVGRLTNGTVFDRSDAPVAMPLDQVVPGFAEAIRLMSRGARYRFWLPPALAYGDSATGPIPAGSVLVFDVQLIDFQPATTAVTGG